MEDGGLGGVGTMFDVVVVGAGAAGVGAVRRLLGNGLAGTGPSVLLIEASDRVGGRAWTQGINGLPLDLGCGWLHSAERNPWTKIAEDAGFTVDRRTPAWGRQWRDIGFSAAEHADADRAYKAWEKRIAATPPPSDRASDALDPGGRWNAWLDARSGYLNGAPLDRLSVADYLAYDRAASDSNWRVAEGYGRLVAASLPALALRLGTPVSAIRLVSGGLRLETQAGVIAARTAIVTASTSVIARGRIALPCECDDHAHAASRLPLGLADKLFLAIDGAAPFEDETGLTGDPRDAETASYYIRPLGRPVIEVFVGGRGAVAREGEGPAASYAFALDELAALLGSGIRAQLRPLVATAWGRADWIGGSYSHALPGHAGARATLAAPVAERLFFAGEATHATDFSTAHGALESGVRAAEQALAALAR